MEGRGVTVVAGRVRKLILLDLRSDRDDKASPRRPEINPRGGSQLSPERANKRREQRANDAAKSCPQQRHRGKRDTAFQQEKF